MAFKSAGSFDTERWDYTNKGDTLEGYFMGWDEPITLEGREVPRLRVKSDEVLYGLLANKVLAGQFKEIPEGCLVRITFLGKQKPKTGGKPYNNFKTEYDEDEKVAVDNRTTAQKAGETLANIE